MNYSNGELQRRKATKEQNLYIISPEHNTYEISLFSGSSQMLETTETPRNLLPKLSIQVPTPILHNFTNQAPNKMKLL